MRGKRGLEREQIIKLIVALIIFAILLLFLIKFKGKDIIDKEACHQSVVMRSLPGIGEATKRSYPLRCKTEDVIINTAKENEIKKQIADKMYDCWWMLGEGKANFFFRPLGPSEVKCLVCYNIKFGDKAKRFGTISGFPDYLNTKTPKGKTYMELFGVKDTLKDPIEQAIDTKKDYAIIFVMSEKRWIEGAAAAASGCIASAMIGAKVAAIVGTATAVVPVVAIYAAPAAGTVTFLVGCGLNLWGAMGIDKLIHGEDYIASLQFLPFSPEDIKSIGCESIESIP